MLFFSSNIILVIGAITYQVNYKQLRSIFKNYLFVWTVIILLIGNFFMNEYFIRQLLDSQGHHGKE